jgi:hypothetical protein
VLKISFLSKIESKKRSEKIFDLLAPIMLNDRSDCRILSMYATGRLAEKR